MTQEVLKARLMAAIEAIQANPQSAKAVFRANTQWEESVRCSGTVRDFPPITVDEPPELGGANAGPNPVELVLVALGTCQEIMYSAYAAVLGIPLESVRVDMRGFLDLRGLFNLDEKIPAGYEKIEFETIIDSPADPKKIMELAQVVQAHCPVLDTLLRPIEVAGKVTHNGLALTV
ncbi:MAG: OsmC family peroxiredoxin [Lautropia sp.]|nr:MAG: OsmC family peroxiredoxin [Pseudomonadota bacterium]MBC6958498.1 OsmC family peroxiredoxin [Lautropia sp.]MBW7926034.1 OsmC family protein [Burkholderiaceae bacterium]MCZ2415742.1 OsmC family protein [Burkholderiales bacterium]MDL1906907.1 OsmC family protein [Betaproteobacteria bacterium PRO1]